MKHVGTILGTAIAGIFVMSVWGAFVGEHGIGGGWFAGLIIIGSMWYLNHFLGLIHNPGAFVDMALGIGIAGFTRDIFMKGIDAGIDSLPTLGVVLLGGLCGGIAAVLVERQMASNKEEAEKVKEAA
jgi:hypothetical protein